MNSRKFKSIGIMIMVVLLAAIIFHSFYFIKNYQEAYAKFTRDVNLSFDKALKDYFEELSGTDVIVITDIQSLANKNIKSDSSALSEAISRDFFQRFNESPFSKNGSKILEKKVQELDGLHITQILVEGKYQQEEEVFVDQKNDIVMMAGRKAADSILSLPSISNRLVISVTRDTTDFQLLNSYFNEKLRENQLDITYGIKHTKRDFTIGTYQAQIISQMPLQYTANRELLPSNEKIILYYENTSLSILKEGFSNSLFSLAFFLLIIFVLAFLYKTIKNQKDLAEIKNDLINNITHEFKTPLATISTSVEALQNFNPENDPAKIKKYLAIGQQQVNKMNGMVEKLLETATLDSEKLMIKKENINVSLFCKELFDRYQNHNTDKTLTLKVADQDTVIKADRFHLENALSNLLDNAFKYGGRKISLAYHFNDGRHCFSVKDNGGNLSKAQAKKVFDKFYRIPQGNIHNVKGFGIGLYYSKKVIEKHQGNLELHIAKNLTHFEACLP